MKRFFFLSTFFLLFVSTAFAQELSETNQQIIDLIIHAKNNEFVEFSDMYETTATAIKSDEEEKILIVQFLKKKGFKVENWGRGNFPYGPRIISIEMVKADCRCDVAKLYYTYDSDGTIEVKEKIRCYQIKNKP
ncbi:MAG: hypothetical protein V4535_11320 [Bacteroidota bacterium]